MQEQLTELTQTQTLVPRDYQVTGIDYLTTPRVKHNINDDFPTLCRAMLTDAPGAGKTLQAMLAATKKLSQTHATLVICPAHLVKQWYNDILRQFPDDHIVSVEGSAKYTYLRMSNIDWLIVSTQSLSSAKLVEATTKSVITNHVHVAIIDESHYLKNASAKRSIAVRKLCRPDFIPHCFLLTATPIIREANDLYSQLRIIDPLSFHSFDSFLNKYCWFTYSSYGPQNVSLKTGHYAAHKLLEGTHPTEKSANYYQAPDGTVTQGWMLGRSYAQIGLSLPPIIPPPNSPDALVSIPLPRQLRNAYDDIKTFWQHSITSDDGSKHAVLTTSNAMEVMHLLRALTNCEEKRSKLISYLETDPGPFLIGCFYKRSVSQLCIALTEAGYNPILVTGDVPADIRPSVAKSAVSPRDVVVATISSITEGCNLSHLNTVLFYEEDYTPGKMYQFMSRVRRHRDADPNSQPLDQIAITTDDQGTFHLELPYDANETPVICRYFHAANTIDERIHAVQSNRAVNIKDIVKVELAS